MSDYVRCIDVSESLYCSIPARLTLDKVYKVISCSNGFIRIIDDTGSNYRYLHWRFQDHEKQYGSEDMEEIGSCTVDFSCLVV